MNTVVQFVSEKLEAAGLADTVAEGERVLMDVIYKKDLSSVIDMAGAIQSGHFTMSDIVHDINGLRRQEKMFVPRSIGWGKEYKP